MPLVQPYPDLGALDLLVSVGELGSISAAARAHHVTQPAASMRLRSLEDALQVQLLNRSRTGASLTPAGLATVEWAGAVLREVTTLLAGTSALRADQDSHLHIAASLTVAEYLAPRWLQRLAGDSPGVKVSLEMGNTAHVVDLVANGNAELGFVEGPEPPDHLRHEQVRTDQLVVVVGAGHPWSRRRRPLSPQELAATPLVLREPGSGTRDVLAETLAEHHLTLTPEIELGSTTAIKSAVIAGAGPAVVSILTVAAEIHDRRLIAIPCEAIHLQRVIRAVWNTDRLPRVARQLIDIAAEDTPKK